MKKEDFNKLVQWCKEDPRSAAIMIESSTQCVEKLLEQLRKYQDEINNMRNGIW